MRAWFSFCRSPNPLLLPPLPSPPQRHIASLSPSPPPPPSLIHSLPPFTFVIPAGSSHLLPLKIPPNKVPPNTAFRLHWLFDVANNLDCKFSVHLAPTIATSSHPVFPSRKITGGSEGNVRVSGAAALVMSWGNGGAWIQPRTVRVRVLEVFLAD